MRNSFFTVALALCCWSCQSFAADSIEAQFVGSFNGQSARRVAEPAWAPNIIASPVQRYQLSQMPIQSRPYRPFHFYGNTVRRAYYRGNPLPMPRDFRAEFISPFVRIIRR